MSCNDCDMVYIGETGRLLKERAEERRNAEDKPKSNLMFSRRDINSISWTSVLLENQITSEYDEYVLNSLISDN